MTPDPSTPTPAATPRPLLISNAARLAGSVRGRLARLRPALAELQAELAWFLAVAPGAIRGALSAQEKFRAAILAAAAGTPAGLIAFLGHQLGCSEAFQAAWFFAPAVIYAADRARRWYQGHPAVAVAEAQVTAAAGTLADLLDHVRAAAGPAAILDPPAVASPPR